MTERQEPERQAQPVPGRLGQERMGLGLADVQPVQPLAQTGQVNKQIEVSSCYLPHNRIERTGLLRHGGC